jgi:hypothetical protein
VGATGPQGNVGPQGATGATGSTGAQGVPGTPGEVWFSGTSNPTTVAGAVSGDWYLNTTTGAVYELVGTTWTARGSIQGPQGVQGPQGIQGTQGPQGVKGDTGAQGIQGVKGDTGATGSQGPIGNTGAQGIQGPQGVQGVQGPTGQPIYVQDTAPVGVPNSTLWWESDSGALFVYYMDPNTTQWVQVNAAGMPEAPKDGSAYGRKDGAWVATLPLAGGGEVTGSLSVNRNSVGYAITGDNDSSANGAGGVLGYSGASYGIVGYHASGIGYAFYGAGELYNSGYATFNGGLGVTTGYTTLSNGLGVTGATTFTGITAVASGYYFYAAGAPSNVYAIQASPGALGGVIGFGTTGSYYCISGYGGYGIYSQGTVYCGSGNITGTGNVGVDGYIGGTRSGTDTTTNSATAWIGSNGTIMRSTSSIRFKTNVEPLLAEYADKVLELEPIYYTPMNTKDPGGYTRFGFTAEQAYAADPRFTTCYPQTLVGHEDLMEDMPNPAWGDWNGEGDEPPKTIYARSRNGAPIYEDRVDIQNLDLNGIVAALQHVVRRQQARIEALEAKLGV